MGEGEAEESSINLALTHIHPRAIRMSFLIERPNSDSLQKAQAGEMASQSDS